MHSAAAVLHTQLLLDCQGEVKARNTYRQDGCVIKSMHSMSNARQ